MVRTETLVLTACPQVCPVFPVFPEVDHVLDCVSNDVVR